MSQIHEDENWEFRETDWNLLTDLYTDVFKILMDKGEFSILELNEVNDYDKARWLSQKENIDIFMMFVISETVLESDYTGEDDRLRLFKLLCEKNPEFRILENRKLLSKLDREAESLNWNELSVSPYTIYIEE